MQKLSWKEWKAKVDEILIWTVEMIAEDLEAPFYLYWQAGYNPLRSAQMACINKWGDKAPRLQYEDSP